MTKKERQITVVLAIIGNYLFYNQSTGINVLLFTLLSAVILRWLHPAIKLKKLAIAIIPSILCALFIVWYPQLITRIMWHLCFLMMWFSIKPSPYIIVVFLQAFNSLVKTPFLTLKRKSKTTKTDRGNKKQLLLYLITGSIVFVFVALYSQSNPLFSIYVSKIDVSFINYGWLLSAFWIFFLLLGLVTPTTQASISKLNRKAAQIEEKASSKRDEQEFSIAKLTIWILGAILSVINIGDLLVLFTGSLPDGITYSKYVHQGFNTLIFTISLAIGLIIYFFRGQLNFHENFSLLKKASSFWIAQNLLLAFITAYKNILYIDEYGLTYKRTAVFIALICVILGLFLSFKKLQKTFSNWYFFNKLTLYTFTFFVAISLIPIDKMICRYNLKYTQNVDIEYLLDLSKPDLLSIENYIQKNKLNYPKEILNAKRLDVAEQKPNSNWKSWNYYSYEYNFLK